MAAESPTPRIATSLGAALAVTLLLTACSSSPEPAAASAAAVPSASPSHVAPSAAGSPTASSASPSASGLDRTATPASTSGALGPRSLPFARTLGPRWSAHVDAGNAEDGYTGNGTAVVARDPGDVIAGLLPYGCAADAVYATPLPVPAHALEADYSYPPTGAHANGLVLEFRDMTTARRFARVYTAALRACTAGSTVVTVLPAPAAGFFLSTQVDSVEHETWRELVAPAGRVVRLLAVEGARTPIRPWAAIAADLPAPA